MKEKKILLIIFFNLIIIFSEVLFGFISNSYALIADALHNAGDVLAVVITYLALRLADVKSSYRFTFGFYKAEMMAGFVNTLFLFVTMFYLLYEALLRLNTPQEVEPSYMIIVGFIALIANGVSAYILKNLNVSSCAHSHKEHHHNDTNISSAYLHMLSDALISAGVVIAGIVIYFFHIYFIDALLTIIFSIYILFHAYPLLKRSFLALMDINTISLSETELVKIIKKGNSVSHLEDLHIYTPNSKEQFISFAIVLSDATLSLKESLDTLENIEKELKIKGFSHITIALKSDINKSQNHYCSKE